MKIKKFIESLRAILEKEKDTEKIKKFLKEADEKCQSESEDENEDEGKLKSDEAGDKSEAYQALFKKHEAMSKKMEGIDNLIKELTDFLKSEKDEGHEADSGDDDKTKEESEDEAKKMKSAKDKDIKDEKDKMESNRDFRLYAIKSLLKEAKIPDNKLAAFNISELSKKNFKEAKAEIKRTIALMELPFADGINIFESKKDVKVMDGFSPELLK